MSQVIEIIRLLLRKRIYLNVTDSRRRTPLHLAILYGLHGVASTLLREHSCDITLCDITLRVRTLLWEHCG